MSAAIEIAGLRVAYEADVEILRGVSLSGPANTMTAIIGPNGAGKSTLLKGVAGVAPVTGGEIHLGDKRIDRLSTAELVQYGVSFVPQEASVFGQMTVAENIRLGGWTRRREKAWLEKRIEICGNLFASIRPHLDRYAGDLSGGQQKLVEIARGLVAEPQLLLLDEPTAGLSPIMVKEVYTELARLKDMRSVTVLLVEQNVREALAVADHVYVLATGRNDTDGTASEVASRLDEIVRNWMLREGSGVAS
ncbi:ABC transporter ATP-binding protein [Mesorhizobium sp. 131-2-1]|uniref:ABC transporter ATP-binding protein n=1 Tax=Mesorhizobium sp. 131-2-1 TaxID=2744518 RepID=UPI0018ED8D7A|nr:ABC transporter ATP-binding protein [Mesorhizobium sp. 131-2-1]BCG97824.1 ABC transporter ATP-binding protein [Mesorhizobium sp. 131-2-1]